MRDKIKYADKWSHCEVRWNHYYRMWTLCAVTDDDKEVGEREYYTLQKDAIEDGMAYTASSRCDRTDIYTKWGKLGRTV